MPPLIRKDTSDLQFDPLEPTRSLLRHPWRPPWSTWTSYNSLFLKISSGSMNQNQVPSLGHLVLVCFGKTFKYTTDPWLSKWPICVKMMPIFADICSIPDNMPEQTCNLSHASQAVLVKKNWAVVKFSRIDGKNTFFCVISTYHARVFTKKQNKSE